MRVRQIQTSEKLARLVILRFLDLKVFSLLRKNQQEPIGLFVDFILSNYIEFSRLDRQSYGFIRLVGTELC